MVIERLKSARLIMVFLDSSHTGISRFMAASDGIKERKVVHQVSSELTGQIVLDNVVYENIDGELAHLFPSKDLAVDLSSDLSVDHEHLASSYHSRIVFGFTLISSYLERVALSRGTNGPTPHPQTPPRNKRDEEFTEEDNRNELEYIQAINILSQGLPRRIFNILNQNKKGREIWVNLELLMKGFGQTLERRKEALFDEFKRFRANGNELIQDYFVRFHKLVNDMKVTQLDIPTHQLNTKFTNNLSSYWEHALKSLKKKEQSSAVVDPLAYLAKTSPTHSTTSPVTKQFPPTNNQLWTSSNPKTHATVHDGQIVTKTVQRRALGNTRTKGIQTNGSGVNNSGKKVICYNCCGEGHVARQCKEPKRTHDSQWYHDKALLMQAKEKGVVLDVEAEAFLADVECTALYDQALALTTTNLFESNHEDAYDFDVDEGPHASAAFMANLSSTGGINEHLNSKVDSVLDDNMITYDEYQNDSEVEAVPTVVSDDEADKQSMIAVLQCKHTEIAGYVRVNDEHKLVNATVTAELEWC
nr:hypothetical protein [Tanacetum cinerariifolium]